jgi:hypothetical protein
MAIGASLVCDLYLGIDLLDVFHPLPLLQNSVAITGRAHTTASDIGFKLFSARDAFFLPSYKTSGEINASSKDGRIGLIREPGNTGKHMKQNQLTKAHFCLEQIVKRTAHLCLANEIDAGHASEAYVAANRLSACLGTAGSPSSETITEFRRLCEAILEIHDSGEYGSYLNDCVADTNVIASLIRLWGQSGDQSNKPHRSGSDVVYQVRCFEGNAYLVERRSGGDSMRIPQSDYLAAVNSFSDTGASLLGFSDLIARFEANGGQAVPSQYPLRIVLRYWRSLEPPLVVRESARYRCTTYDFAEFQEMAVSAWDAAAEFEVNTTAEIGSS